ncbi:transcriptional regulator [Advenella faeciporci]|uniref:Transcriptional regulator n=1 Tax=Advenella faeciporci TaxID=797535 RepID=A0A918JLJ1_9BURK|nr:MULTISPECIES: DNA-binding transcriptional regulator [Advenella]GGW88094.1 transcriptional regulator [Advenella faeciporci]
MTDKTTNYAHVRGLSRGLAILKALNQMQSGHASSQQLSQMVGLHRTTVRRLLETLITEGLVRRSDSDDTYRLTIKVRELSEGFTDDEWISSMAAPLMGELMQRIVWPSDLTTSDGSEMIIRETTHRYSPLSFHRAMVGRRLPMLLTSAGRAYFANINDSEQENILSLLRSGSAGEEQAALANDSAYIKNLIRSVRNAGFAWNRGDWSDQQKISAIAVPIIHRTRVLGCLNVVYLTKAMSKKEAEVKFIQPLQDISSKIESMMEKQQLLIESKNSRDACEK